MKRTWRWFGPNDPVGLNEAVQAGATGIVSSLHHIPDGGVWEADEVARYSNVIKAAGLEWSVVESVPVSNQIKVRGPGRAEHLENYRKSLRAVAASGIKTVCYNFIPLVDWVRTELRYPLKSGLALRFDMIDFVACDVFILGRAGATDNYSNEILARAETRYGEMSAERRVELEASVLAPLPGGTVTYSKNEFIQTLRLYEGITERDYLANFTSFLEAVIPCAEECGIKLVLHPDDPPINLFGLPRIAGTSAQLRAVLGAVKSPSNGLTFCVGSLGVREENNLIDMVGEFGPNVGFSHLRNVKREADLSFHEAEHLGGSSDMVGVLNALLNEESARRERGDADWEIPMRPDHGHLMLDDISKSGSKPGYSAVGRLKGLAELNGVIAALEWARRTGGAVARSA